MNTDFAEESDFVIVNNLSSPLPFRICHMLLYQLWQTVLFNGLSLNIHSTCVDLPIVECLINRSNSLN